MAWFDMVAKQSASIVVIDREKKPIEHEKNIENERTEISGEKYRFFR